ncbi:MAG TPA: HAMP domain-containing protein, partial [Candidatus Bathyarchaeia archaeon]|nr:HAMP domain-containing protein [Candidatus Bathyarchaeia archaeon]
MKISQKISLFVLFLLAVLAVNTLVGLEELAKFNRDIRLAISQDLKLHQSVMTLSRCQLGRSMLFERLLTVAEELAFVDLSSQRQDYLSRQIESIQHELDQLNNTTADSIAATRAVVVQGKKTATDKDRIQELESIAAFLSGIEKQHGDHYAILIETIAAMRNNELQNAIAQLTNNRHETAKLHDELGRFSAQIQVFAEHSLSRAQYEEFVARNILWASFWFSLLIITLIAFAAIYSIATPLKDLIHAARRVKDGELPTPLEKFPSDEIGDVTTAFNVMTQKLIDSNHELQKKQVELNQHLHETEQQKAD